MAVPKTTNVDFANRSAKPNQKHKTIRPFISDRKGILEKQKLTQNLMHKSQRYPQIWPDLLR